MAPREQLVVLLTLTASQGPGYLAAPVFTQLIQNASQDPSDTGLNVCQLSALEAATTPGNDPNSGNVEALFQLNCPEARSPIEPLASLGASPECKDEGFIESDPMLCASPDQYVESLKAALQDLDDADDPDEEPTPSS